MASNWPSCINPCKNTRNDSWSCCSLIGHKKTKVFWHQSEARTTPTIWNWSGKTVSPGAPRFVLYFSSPKFFSPVTTFPRPTNCPWVSEDGLIQANMTWCFTRMGPTYHWIVDLYSRMGLPVLYGVQERVCFLISRMFSRSEQLKLFTS